MLKMTVRGVKKLQKDITVEGKRQRKALEFCIRHQAFLLRKQLMSEMKSGAPGGRPYKRLSFLARGLGNQTSNRLRDDSPFGRMRGAVRYHVERSPGYEAHVGFTKKSPKAAFFRAMAKKHAEGFTQRITDRQRRYIIKQGARRLHGHRDAEAVSRTPYYLRKSTKTFRTPPRPIMEPFWEKHERLAMANIRKNFRLKLMGKRI